MTTQSRLEEIFARHAGREGPLLPILRDIQAEFGCVDRTAEEAAAKALNLSRAEVHGVASFYHDFLSAPDNRPEVQICRAEACKARGVDGIIDQAENAAGERVRLTAVYCLGLCSTGPNARVKDRLYSRLDGATLTEVINQA